MQKKKRQVPLDVLKELDIIKDINEDIFELHYPDDCIVEIRERNIESDFAYKINRTEIGSIGNEDGINIMGNHIIRTKNPISVVNSAGAKNKISLENFQKDFLEWTDIVAEYHKLETIFDDLIAKSYEEEFYQKWTMAEEDANTKPFSTDRVMLIDSFLENVQKQLDTPEYKSESNAKQIDNINSEIQEIRDNLTTQTQSSAIRKISRIYSKISKLGIHVVKGFLKVSEGEAYKMIFKQGISYAKNIIENMGDVIS